LNYCYFEKPSAEKVEGFFFDLVVKIFRKEIVGLFLLMTTLKYIFVYEKIV
jgi:hypothetical protein